MKARSASIYGLLALAGLIAAYVTWQRPKTEQTSTTIRLVDATKQSLQKVRYQDGTRFLQLERREGAEASTWITLGHLPGQQPVAVDAGPELTSIDGGAADGGTLAVRVTPPPPAPTRTTRGNERADSLLAKFTPLDATRALGVLSDEKRKELGLTDASRHLTLTVAGAQRSFTVSKPQTGILGLYLQDTGNNEVYLLQSSLLSELDPTSQVLVDRRLHRFQPQDYDGITLTLNGQSVSFVQKDAQIPQTLKLARAATPDKPDELAKNWHEKMWTRVIVTEVLGENELPRLGEPTSALRLEYTQAGKQKGWLEIGFDVTHAPWARSENTASWVAVHQGVEEFVTEAQKLLTP